MIPENRFGYLKKQKFRFIFFRPEFKPAALSFICQYWLRDSKVYCHVCNRNQFNCYSKVYTLLLNRQNLRS